MMDLRCEDFLEFARNIDAYKDSEKENHFNKKSHLWDFILGSRINLNTADSEEIISTYSNFLNPGSNQTSGVSDWKRDINYNLIRYFEDMIPVSVLDKYPCPATGNPLLFKLHGKLSCTAHAWNLITLQIIMGAYEKSQGSNHCSNIIEIGAGYGSSALNWIKSGKAKSYTIIDLCENLLNSYYYLSQNLPDGWELEVVRESTVFQENKVYLLSPGYIDLLDDCYYDLAINSDSLGEMPVETAKAYVKWVHSHLKPNGLFVSKNGHKRSRDAITQVSEYGYDVFQLLELRPAGFSSSAFDDFSHVIVLRKSESNVSWGANQITYLNTLADIFRCGVSDDLTELIKRYSDDCLSSTDVAFLSACENFFTTGNLELVRRENQVIFYIFACMRHLPDFVQNAQAVRYSILYLLYGKSPNARVYAYMSLFRAGLIKQSDSSGDSPLVNYFVNFMICECGNPIKKYIYLRINSEYIKRKIKPRSDFHPSIFMKVKNLTLNFLESKKFSFDRG